MRVLLTGCAGFIGSRTVNLLCALNHDVVGIDNLNNYYDPKLKYERLDILRQNPHFHFIRGDITKDGNSNIFMDYHFDAIINLAARAGVRASLDDPYAYIDTNITGTVKLLEMCRMFDIPKYVMASSSSVYGTSEPPFSETTNSDHSMSPYAATKKAAEALCYSYHHVYGIDITIPRYFTVFGEAGRPDMSIYRFIEGIRKGIPIDIYGDGTQQRDFSYVGDIAEGTIRCLKPLGYEIINLGNDNPVELNYVIKLIEEALGKEATRTYLPKQEADVMKTHADISLARKLLDWEPRVPIEEGIKRTVKWHLSRAEQKH